ncbi:MAG TPA: hypothetical protein VF316_14890 [Polyangiaceae bacterium]
MLRDEVGRVRVVVVVLAHVFPFFGRSAAWSKSAACSGRVVTASLLLQDFTFGKLDGAEPDAAERYHGSAMPYASRTSAPSWSA